jgi:hypothetical protein
MTDDDISKYLPSEERLRRLGDRAASEENKRRALGDPRVRQAIGPPDARRAPPAEQQSKRHGAGARDAQAAIAMAVPAASSADLPRVMIRARRPCPSWRVIAGAVAAVIVPLGLMYWLLVPRGRIAETAEGTASATVAATAPPAGTPSAADTASGSAAAAPTASPAASASTPAPAPSDEGSASTGIDNRARKEGLSTPKPSATVLGPRPPASHAGVRAPLPGPTSTAKASAAPPPSSTRKPSIEPLPGGDKPEF